jgi:hypothetical protein
MRKFSKAWIRKWESSHHNFADSKLAVVKLKFFPGFLSYPKIAKPQNVGIELDGALRAESAVEAQTKALAHFLAHEKDLYPKVRKAIYKSYKYWYPKLRPGLGRGPGPGIFGATQAEIERTMPKIVKGDELDKLVKFIEVRVENPEETETTVPYIEISFSREWSADILCVHLRKSKIVDVG